MEGARSQPPRETKSSHLLDHAEASSTDGIGRRHAEKTVGWGKFV